MARDTLRTGGKILTDIAERSPIVAASAGETVSKNVTESAKILISKLRGRGRKRAREAVGGKKKNGPKPQKIQHAPRKIIKGIFV